MTLTVRSATVSGATTKGSALTHAELDENFNHLSQSSNHTFTPSGSGAQSRTMQAVERAVARSGDFDTAGNFNTAVTALTETFGVADLQVQAGGAIGIGATSPGTELEISKTGAWPLIRLRKSGTGYWDIGPVNGNFLGISVNGGTDIVTIDNTGLVGINQVAPLAQLHVGDRTEVPITTAILASHEFSATTSRHGFGDFCVFAGNAGTGYASFDSYAQLEGTTNLDHWVGFQCRLEYDSTGTMSDGYGFYSGLHVNSGTITDLFAGLHVVDPTGSGTVTNLYGIYLAALTKGGTKNFAIYTEGLAAVVIGGATNGGSTAGGAKLRTIITDGVYSLGLSGTTMGVRVAHNANRSIIDGVDTTLNASYQKLLLNGSLLEFGTGGTIRATIGNNGQFYPATDAGAAQTSAGIFAGSGAPSDANGNNGDFYFRSGGTVAGNTIIYHQEAGSWVAATTT
jgi:hypothetical protein